MIKIKVVLILMLLGYTFAKLGNTNNEDAETPEDVLAFRAMHQDDTCILFFHDGADAKETGFFESIFGIFGTKDVDEEYQKLLAEKFATLEIDKQIYALKNVPDTYEVTDLPYIIAYHKGREIWREMPSKDSAKIIENLIKTQNETNIQVYPKGHTPIPPTNRTSQRIKVVEVDRPVIVPTGRPIYTGDAEYGHLVRENNYAIPRERVVYNGATDYRANNDYVIVEDPRYTQNSRRVVRDNLNPATTTGSGNTYGYASNGSGYKGTISSSGSTTSTGGSRASNSVDNGFTNRVISKPNTSQGGSGSQASSTQASQRNSANDWSKDSSYGPAEIESGITVRKYDADKGRV